MAGIPETQLQTWSNQGSIVQSQDTFDSIKKCLDDSESGYASESTENYLQGSFGNDTNIYADSDVDVVQVLRSTFYRDLSSLDEQQRRAYNEHYSDATYGYLEFKRDVAAQLRKCYGSNVKIGNKAIFVPGHGSRRDADVVPAVQYRKYYGFEGALNQRYAEGIVFWASDGTKIVNYPKLHQGNCASKNASTTQRFKPNVRVFKNLRNAMVRDGYLTKGTAPSYFVEGALYNVPNHLFSYSHRETVWNALEWWNSCQRSDLVCANEMHILLHPTSPVTWRREQFDNFINCAKKYWNDY